MPGTSTRPNRLFDSEAVDPSSVPEAPRRTWDEFVACSKRIVVAPETALGAENKAAQESAKASDYYSVEEMATYASRGRSRVGAPLDHAITAKNETWPPLPPLSTNTIFEPVAWAQCEWLTAKSGDVQSCRA